MWLAPQGWLDLFSVTYSTLHSTYGFPFWLHRVEQRLTILCCVGLTTCHNRTGTIKTKSQTLFKTLHTIKLIFLIWIFFSPKMKSGDLAFTTMFLKLVLRDAQTVPVFAPYWELGESKNVDWIKKILLYKMKITLWWQDDHRIGEISAIQELQERHADSAPCLLLKWWWRSDVINRVSHFSFLLYPWGRNRVSFWSTMNGIAA